MAADGQTKQLPVYLLKTKSLPADGYEEYFSTIEFGLFKPTFVPVLEHQFRKTSIDWLYSTTKAGGFSLSSNATTSDRFGGIIFTSQRAVEAFTQIVQFLDPSERNTLLSPDFVLYAVGPATAKGLRSLHLACPILGEETGNGEALAAFMLEDYNKRHPRGEKLPLLFLVGEQRRDIIPKTLQSSDLSDERRIKVVESTVYETGEMQSFRSDFSAILSENEKSGRAEQWAVVFSPTGCKAMLECLGWLNEDTGRYDAELSASRWKHTRIATIGPTTRDYLVSQFGFEPHVCAAKPSYEGIGDGIVEYRNQST
ncbi:hypothetical protein MBLNU457_2269t3 [Dothideomycetes sp. NU457]